ncbi:MAG: entericidin A/B family lipoprotein [Aquisalimonadaceae bacterium]
MTKLLAKFLLSAIIGMAVVAAVGCNTMEGAGEDMQDTGEAVEDQAD